MNALAWNGGPTRFVAFCGSQHQGRACVWRSATGWHWLVDMLPGDSEPAITNEKPLDNRDAAMRAAEQQVEAWPKLIEGARR